MGLVVFVAAVVVSDRHRSQATLTAAIAGLLWPLFLFGAVQWALWVGVAKSLRLRAGRSAAPALKVNSSAPPL